MKPFRSARFAAAFASGCDRFQRAGARGQWPALVVLSLAAGGLLTWAGIPAALLLGPLLAGIAVTAAGASLRVPPVATNASLSLLGCMIARMLSAAFSGPAIAGHGWLFAGGVLSVIVASAALGWVMVRLRLLPGTTAVWGLSPGAATIMTVLAESHGADAQLVAFMQYLRVIVVALVASVIARCCGFGADTVAAGAAVPHAFEWISFGETVAIAVAGAWLARWWRIRAGALLLPLVLGVVLTQFGHVTLVLPRWLLALGYMVIGWRIGLRFTRPLLVHVARAFPRVLLGVVALIAVCGGLALALVALVHVDPLTAYLATSPGGADTAAIIAASSHVDRSFVMAMQTIRSVAVLLLGPVLARVVARYAVPAEASAVSST